MSEIQKRFRTRTWNAADLDKVTKLTMGPFVAGGLLCMFMFDAETGERGNAALLTGMAIMAVPCALFRWWLYSHCGRDLPFGGGTMARVLASLFAGAVLGLVGGGYWYAINAATGSPAPVMVQGPVVKLAWTSGGLGGAGRNVTVRFEGHEVTFSETAATYAQLKVGDVFRTEARLGGLGYYWRPGRSVWK
jgi:hypothetical protein